MHLQFQTPNNLFNIRILRISNYFKLIFYQIFVNLFDARGVYNQQPSWKKESRIFNNSFIISQGVQTSITLNIFPMKINRFNSELNLQPLNPKTAS